MASLGRALGKQVRDIIRNLGENCTYEQVCDRLWQMDGSRCSKTTFEAHKISVFRQGRSPGTAPTANGHTETSLPAIPETVPIPDELPMPETKALDKFVGFAVAVERVGGVSAARKMLDIMEKLQGML